MKVAAQFVNDNPEIMPNHTLVLDVRDIKKDRYVAYVAI